MPSADTFSVPPIGAFVERWLDGRKIIVDPFARNSKLASHSNDLNPDTAAQWHMDAIEFCDLMLAEGLRADAAIFDPPYSPRQVSECYQLAGLKAGMEETQNAALYAKVKKRLADILKPGGVALSFGWNSSGFKGFKTMELLLVCHGSAHNDTICVAQVKPDNLFEVAHPSRSVT